MPTESTPPDDSGVPTLAQLIADRKTQRGLSYGDLESRAGFVISRQRWQQLGTNLRVKEFPEPATLEAMAAALEVDVALIVLATARSIGLPVESGAQSDLARMLPSSARHLTVEQRDAVLAVVRAMSHRSIELARPEGGAVLDFPSRSNDDEPPPVDKATAAREVRKFPKQDLQPPDGDE